MRHFLIITFGLAFVLLLFHGQSMVPKKIQETVFSSTHDDVKTKIDTSAYFSKQAEALAYCKKKKWNTTWCLLADMGRHSGTKRLYIWNFKDSSIGRSFLVSHGCGKQPWGMDLSKKEGIFSNVPESHCSSLGKYRIGERGVSQWGIKVKYLMHGQDTSNNNALKRAIVFHSWEAVADNEIYPRGTPEGWGCPAVSNKGMLVLDSFINASKQSVLLWQFVD